MSRSGYTENMSKQSACYHFLSSFHHSFASSSTRSFSCRDHGCVSHHKSSPLLVFEFQSHRCVPRPLDLASLRTELPWRCTIAVLHCPLAFIWLRTQERNAALAPHMQGYWAFLIRTHRLRTSDDRPVSLVYQAPKYGLKTTF